MDKEVIKRRLIYIKKYINNDDVLEEIIKDVYLCGKTDGSKGVQNLFAQAVREIEKITLDSY